jgi:methylated-DNA-protein-cysteine methyltransferase-like protein
VARLYAEFYRVVRRIPRGRVATYGQVAELAGHPGAARAAGAAMRACDGTTLPWQRVIGKQARNLGKVAIHDPVGGTIQRKLLEKEGVRFTDAGNIRLDTYGWIPGSRGAARRRR